MTTLMSALLLQEGYNAALVALGAACLGAAGGLIGTFTLLRKRALVSDAIGHAALPGVAIGFLAAAAITGEGRNLLLLLPGAALFAVLAVLLIDAIRARTRLNEDVAIASVLSTFFSLGVVLLTIIQNLPLGGQAGLSSFLLGSAAGLIYSEAMLLASASMVLFCTVLACFKEFRLVCFDEDFARATGYRVLWIDRMILLLLLMIVILGLKTVGLILSIALTVIPPVTARLWTRRLITMAMLSAAIGAFSGYVGAAFSAIAPQWPTGPLIVLTGTTLLAVSMLVAPAQGILPLMLRRAKA